MSSTVAWSAGDRRRSIDCRCLTRLLPCVPTLLTVALPAASPSRRRPPLSHRRLRPVADMVGVVLHALAITRLVLLETLLLLLLPQVMMIT